MLEFFFLFVTFNNILTMYICECGFVHGMAALKTFITLFINLHMSVYWRWGPCHTAYL